mgnify:CR=1 FL=1
MHTKLFGWLLLGLLGSSTLQAQEFTQTIRGKVVDAQSKYPLAGANIVLLDSEPVHGTTTDANGNFRMEKVKIGRQNLQASYLGYKTAVLSNLILNSSRELVLEIELQEQVITGKEIKILADKAEDGRVKNELSLVSARTFSVEETQRYAGSFGDPARLASTFAGVTSVNDQRNDIIVRGNSPLGILWRMEGVDIPSPNHFSGAGSSGGAISILNTNLLDNADFLSGAFAPEYGNATAGVFDMSLRKGNNEKQEFLGQIGFNGFELNAEGPLSKKQQSSYIASYRYSTLAVFDALGIDFVEGGIPMYQDAAFKLHFPMKKGSLSVFGIGGTSDIHFKASTDSVERRNNPEREQDLKNGSDMALLGTSYHHYFSEKTSWKNTLATNVGRFRTTVDSLDFSENRFPQFSSAITEGRVQWHSQLNHKISSRHSIRSGVLLTGLWLNNEVQVPDDSAVNVLRSYITFTGQTALAQAYSQYVFRMNARFTLTGGFHFSWLTLNNTYAIEPRFSMNYDIDEKQAVQLGYGRHSRVLPLNIYLIETPINGQAVRTNKNLELSKSDHFVLGYNRSFSPKLRLKAELYYQYLSDIPVEIRPSAISIANFGAIFGDVTAPDSLVSSGTGSNYGLELTIEKTFSNNYYFLATASLFDSRYTGSDGVERNTLFNSNYTTNVLAGKEWPVGKSKQNVFTLSGRISWTGGRRYVPIDLAASQANLDETYDWSVAYLNRYPDFFRLDWRIGFKRNKKRFTEEWAIDIQNATNRQNFFAEQFNVKTGQIQTFYQVGLFPVALYRITF